MCRAVARKKHTCKLSTLGRLQHVVSRSMRDARTTLESVRIFLRGFPEVKKRRKEEAILETVNVTLFLFVPVCGEEAKSVSFTTRTNGLY